MRTWALLLMTFGFAWGGARAQRWGVRAVDGKPLAALAPPNRTRAVVLFFVATDCPVSNRMFPEMRRLREEFGGRGVRLWFVYPNTYERAEAVVAHQQSFDAGGEALLDPDGTLVRLTRAVATPEMAVLVPEADGWRTVYAGRIDDRYVRLGLERPAATVHFGEDTLLAVLAGRAPKPAVGVPVGCAIVSARAR